MGRTGSFKSGSNASPHGIHSNPTPSTSSSRVPPPPPPETIQQRVERFRKMLRQKHVPLERIKHVVFSEGVPEYGGSTASLRAITWKLLLDYLPPDRAQWDQSLAEQRRSYQAFVQELTTDPNADSAPPPAGATEAAVEVDASDHPLTSSAGSKWVEFHADEDLRAEMRKDVDRTLPDYSFFNRE